MPIGENPILTPLLDKATTLRASAHKLDKGKDLFPNDTFLTLQQMCADTTPTALDTLLYYQIRAACRARFTEFHQAPPTLPALENLLSTPSPRKLITRIYSITKRESPIITATSKADWETDIGTEITDKQLICCCTQLQHLSPNYRLRLIHFNYIHRLYRTPPHLHRMGLYNDTSCWRCGIQNATFTHLAWEYQPIAKYWQEVLKHIGNITDIELHHSPLVALLGYVLEVPLSRRKLTAMLLLLAKRQVAIHWKKMNPPTIAEWIGAATYCKDQLTHYWELMPTRSRPKDIWGHFALWLSMGRADHSRLDPT